jgi:hypothetical protein
LLFERIYAMLVELLEHHQALFEVVLGAIMTQNSRTKYTLCAISHTCKKLHDYLMTMPLWQHCIKMALVMKDINSIKRAILYAKIRKLDTYTTTITYINGKPVVYDLWEDIYGDSEVKSNLYTTVKLDIKYTNKNDLKRRDIGCVDLFTLKSDVDWIKNFISDNDISHDIDGIIVENLIDLRP